MTGVDLFSSASSVFTDFAFFSDNGVFFAGDFYKNNIKSIELNRLVLEDTHISFNSTNFNLIFLII